MLPQPMEIIGIQQNHQSQSVQCPFRPISSDWLLMHTEPMTTWVIDRMRPTFPLIGDILLNLLIAASGIILFLIGFSFSPNHQR